jgi:hypothetical protein
MAVRIIKDPDNKWFLFIDWSDWINGLIDDIGGTIDITSSEWFLETGLVKEASTPGTDDGEYKCFLYGSGGTANQDYEVLNRITYNPSALAPTDFTEDRTITVKIQDK